MYSTVNVNIALVVEVKGYYSYRQVTWLCVGVTSYGWAQTKERRRFPNQNVFHIQKFFKFAVWSSSPVQVHCSLHGPSSTGPKRQALMVFCGDVWFDAAPFLWSRYWSLTSFRFSSAFCCWRCSSESRCCLPTVDVDNRIVIQCFAVPT